MAERAWQSELAHPAMSSEPKPVAVRSRFDGSWATGFELVDVATGGDGAMRFRVRRVSDGWVLPTAFGADDLRYDG